MGFYRREECVLCMIIVILSDKYNILYVDSVSILLQFVCLPSCCVQQIIFIWQNSILSLLKGGPLVGKAWARPAAITRHFPKQTAALAPAKGGDINPVRVLRPVRLMLSPRLTRGGDVSTRRLKGKVKRPIPVKRPSLIPTLMSRGSRVLGWGFCRARLCPARRDSSLWRCLGHVFSWCPLSFTLIVKRSANVACLNGLMISPWSQMSKFAMGSFLLTRLLVRRLVNVLWCFFGRCVIFELHLGVPRY